MVPYWDLSMMFLKAIIFFLKNENCTNKDCVLDRTCTLYKTRHVVNVEVLTHVYPDVD